MFVILLQQQTEEGKKLQQIYIFWVRIYYSLTDRFQIARVIFVSMFCCFVFSFFSFGWILLLRVVGDDVSLGNKMHLIQSNVFHSMPRGIKLNLAICIRKARMERIRIDTYKLLNLKLLFNVVQQQ